MVWNSPRTWVANVTAITAAALNTDLRDNLNYLKSLLDGTGSGAVRVPANLHVQDDDNAWVGHTSTTDRYGMNVDANDWWDYDRTSNTFRFIVGNTVQFTIAAGGALGGSSGVTQFTSTIQRFANDTAFAVDISASNPRIIVDSNDYLEFNRASNYLRLVVGAAEKLRVDSIGQLTGAGFFDSGALTIADTATSALAHGLAYRPRFVWGWCSSVSTAALDGTSAAGVNPIVPDVNAASTVHFTTATGTHISVRNISGGTRYARVFAMV
jgi:hypothetical protein